MGRWLGSIGAYLGEMGRWLGSIGAYLGEMGRWLGEMGLRLGTTVWSARSQAGPETKLATSCPRVVSLRAAALQRTWNLIPR